MNLEFYKYQGTGNDFIIIDNRNLSFPKNDCMLIEKLCNRKFGIGADGLMLIESPPKSPLWGAGGLAFKMVYYNADGKEGSMCGNGGRCIAQFALDMGIVAEEKATFIAIDGEHEFTHKNNLIQLKMIDVENINIYNGDFVLNTGSPHYVKIVENVDRDNFIEDAKNIRYNDDFREEGINVNYISIGDAIKIRTYERGVEDETLSCGTGNVAAAICVALKKNMDTGMLSLITKGGILKVYFTKKENKFTDIWLEGPATFVFKGNFF
jgi:diaminopimelate epimerase